MLVSVGMIKEWMFIAYLFGIALRLSYLNQQVDHEVTNSENSLNDVSSLQIIKVYIDSYLITN